MKYQYLYLINHPSCNELRGKERQEVGESLIYYLPFTFPALSPLLKQSSSALVSESSLHIYPNSQPCIPESIVLAESPWSQVVKPPACILTLPRQKSALGRFEVQRIKKWWHKENRGQPCQSCDFFNLEAGGFAMAFLGEFIS